MKGKCNEISKKTMRKATKGENAIKNGAKSMDHINENKTLMVRKTKLYNIKIIVR
jgi:hypothetical protein